MSFLKVVVLYGFESVAFQKHKTFCWVIFRPWMPDKRLCEHPYHMCVASLEARLVPREMRNSVNILQNIATCILLLHNTIECNRNDVKSYEDIAESQLPWAWSMLDCCSQALPLQQVTNLAFITTRELTSRLGLASALGAWIQTFFVHPAVRFWILEGGAAPSLRLP